MSAIRLFKVPMINDYPEHRGNFIKSTITGNVAFLAENAKVYLMNENIQKAIEAIFAEKRPFQAVERAEPPLLAQAPPRPVISIEAYVSSIERLAKALR